MVLAIVVLCARGVTAATATATTAATTAGSSACASALRELGRVCVRASSAEAVAAKIDAAVASKPRALVVFGFAVCVQSLEDLAAVCGGDHAALSACAALHKAPAPAAAQGPWLSPTKRRTLFASQRYIARRLQEPCAFCGLATFGQLHRAASAALNYTLACYH